MAPSRVVAAKRGGVQPGNLPTGTVFETFPPSSTYKSKVPTIAGSEGGFFGVLFGGIILVALIAVGAFFFIRRRRRRAMSDEVRFPGPGRTLAGAVTGGPRRKGWGKMGDDGGEETISGGRYGDDAFEMGGPNHSTMTLHAAPLSPDPSTTDLPRLTHPYPAQSHLYPDEKGHRGGAGSEVSLTGSDNFEDAKEYGMVGEARAPSPGGHYKEEAGGEK